MRRSRYAAPPLLALALLLLFLLMPQQSSGTGQFLEIQQLVQVPGTGEPNRVTLKVIVLHSVDWGPPRRARFAEAVVMVSGDVRRVSPNGEAVFNVNPGNQTVSVYWTDGRFPVLRTTVLVQQDTEMTVQFTELRVRPDRVEVIADNLAAKSVVTVSATVNIPGEFYVAPPVIRYVDTTGGLSVHPLMTRNDLVSVMPYSLHRSEFTDFSEADMSVLEGEPAEPSVAEVTLEAVITDVVTVVLEGTYVPVLVMNYTVRAVAR